MTRKTGKEKAPLPTAADAKDHKAKAEEALQNFSVTMRVATPSAPNLSPWLKVTSQKTGLFVFVPLPIRLIHQIPDERGGGCIVRGAHGDEATAKESIVEILEALGGYPIGGAASTWAIAG